MSFQMNFRSLLAEKILFLVTLCCGVVFAASGQAQNSADNSKEVTAGESMDNQRLGKLLKQNFPKEQFQLNGPGVWMIQVDGDPDRQASNKQQDEKEGKDSPTDNDGKENNNEANANPDIMNGMLVVMTDERANRMRIMMPIQAFDPSRAEDLKTALIALHANYDRALDARYAVSKGILWSAFIHPLDSLTDADLTSAIEQVRTLRKNTGTTYSSGALQFAPRPAEDDNEKQLDQPIGDPTV